MHDWPQTNCKPPTYRARGCPWSCLWPSRNPAWLDLQRVIKQKPCVTAVGFIKNCKLHHHNKGNKPVCDTRAGEIMQFYWDADVSSRYNFRSIIISSLCKALSFLNQVCLIKVCLLDFKLSCLQLFSLWLPSQYAFKFRWQICGTIQKKTHILLRMINYMICYWFELIESVHSVCSK